MIISSLFQLEHQCNLQPYTFHLHLNSCTAEGRNIVGPSWEAWVSLCWLNAAEFFPQAPICPLAWWKTFQKYEFWCMPFILQFKWGNKAGNIYATTSKGHKAFCNGCKWWGSRNSAVRAPKMTIYWVHDTPGKLYGGNEIWMGLADRWDLDGQKRVPVGGRRGTLGLEKSRIWVVGGSTELVLDGSKDGRPEVRLHGSGGYWEDTTLVRYTGKASQEPMGWCAVFATSIIAAAVLLLDFRLLEMRLTSVSTDSI